MAVQRAQDEKVSKTEGESDIQTTVQLKPMRDPGTDFIRPNALVQAKLNIGKPNDKYEVEADRIADKVVNKEGVSEKKTLPNVPKVQTKEESGSVEDEGAKEEEVTETDIQQKSFDTASQNNNESTLQEKPISASITPVIQRKEQPITEELKQNKIQQKSESTGASEGVESSLKASKGKGSAMDKKTQSSMESSFGSDFSSVRIHTDSTAVSMNKSLSSKAFTNGSDIYFNEGQYNPNTKSGQHLLAHELTHTVQQGATEEKEIQRKPEDNLHLEDGEQALAGVNDEVTDEFGEEKNIHRPQISTEERGEEKPATSEKGNNVDQGAMESKTKPNIDRKEETQPQITASLNDAENKLENIEETEGEEQEEVQKLPEEMSPKELAAHNAKIAYAAAERKPIKIKPKAVELPEIKAPKDARGNTLPGNPIAEAGMMQVGAKIQLLREQAAQLKEKADQERINAEALRGDIHLMYNGIYTSDEFINTADGHTETRKQGVEQTKTNLQNSKERTQKVQDGLPGIIDKAGEGREESEPMSESANERKSANDSESGEDPDAQAEARERGGELNDSQEDAANIDDAIAQTQTKAESMSEDLILANEQNAEVEVQTQEMETKLQEVSDKLIADREINTLVKATLVEKENAPDEHIVGANQLDRDADKKLERSDQLEKELHQVYSSYHNNMSSVQPDENTAVQPQLDHGNGVPNIQMQDGDPVTDVPTPGETQQEVANTEFAEAIQEMDESLETEFDDMNALDKGWFGLRRTYYSIMDSLYKVEWGKFTEDLIRGLVDPVFLVESMGQLFNMVTNPSHRANEGPLEYLLREAAGWATAIAVTFGVLSGLALIGMIALGVINFWFPPSLLWSAPIYTELGMLLSWTGSMLWATTKIALVLHGLVFINDLIATMFSRTSQQLIDNSNQLRSDVDAAAFPIITGLTVGFFKFLGWAGQKLGIVRPKNAPAVGDDVGNAIGDDLAPENQLGDDIADDVADTAAPENQVGDDIADDLVDDAAPENQAGDYVADDLADDAAPENQVGDEVADDLADDAAPENQAGDDVADDLADDAAPENQTGDDVADDTANDDGTPTPDSELSGRRPTTPERPLLDENGQLTEYGRWYYEKPSGFRDKATLNSDVWNNSLDGDGVARGPNGEELSPTNWKTEPRPDRTLATLQEEAANNGWTRRQFLDEYNNPSNYRATVRNPNAQFSGTRPPTPAQAVIDPVSGELTPYGRWYYQRPSGFRNGVRDAVWTEAQNASPDGIVRDPVTGAEMLRTEPWDMGHKYGYEFWKHRASAARRGITREQFITEHNTVDHFRPELPSSNSSHAGEAPAGIYHGP